MTREEVAAFLARVGWTEDSDGRFHKTAGRDHFRMTLKPRVARYEIRVDSSKPSSRHTGRWLRVCSGYYVNMSVFRDTLRGMNRC